MLDRRRFLAALSLAALATPLRAQEIAELDPTSTADQTGALQSAIDAAASRGHGLHLPAGTYRTATLRLPQGLILSGIPGATTLVHAGDEALIEIESDDVTLSGLSLDGNGGDGTRTHGGLIQISAVQGVTIRDCAAHNTRLNGISVYDAAVRIDNCDLYDCAHAGLFSVDSRGIFVTGNRIHDCANGGIRIWRYESGPDGSIVTGNRIRAIDWTEGGNGQNGNGINVFRADEVIVSDNHISDCAFTAVRLNATNNTQIRGNTCLNSGEVAIFSEFEFSGSVIANNIVDGAAAGISMTNYIDDGRLAVCTGNIVRNITPSSAVNPDTTPYGIAAEADAVISANVVENVPGVGILIGWGPYLRDVSATGNMVRDCTTAITVSVAEGAGSALIANNVISGAQTAISANRWTEIASADLIADADRFPQHTITGNSVI
jgi:uncharacterized secreted repeat protein (TIGR03808 family)